MKILYIGDVVGKPGRRILHRKLAELRKGLGIDFVVANAENAADGYGLTPAIADDLASSGVDLITLGDHLWDRKDIVPSLDSNPRLVRPFNYPPGAPGRGSVVVETASGARLAVLCLQGRVFMFKQTLDEPLRLAVAEVERLRKETPLVVVELHAEATSEKAALGWHLDGKASAVIGTHTHVQTADEQVLPGGTAFISDAGMTGPADGVIGFDRSSVVERFLTQVRKNWKVADGRTQLCGVVLDIDAGTGRAASITRIRETMGAEE